MNDEDEPPVALLNMKTSSSPSPSSKKDTVRGACTILPFHVVFERLRCSHLPAARTRRCVPQTTCRSTTLVQSFPLTTRRCECRMIQPLGTFQQPTRGLRGPKISRKIQIHGSRHTLSATFMTPIHSVRTRERITVSHVHTLLATNDERRQPCYRRCLR